MDGALFETQAGYAVFKLLNEKKIKDTENLSSNFSTPEQASKIIKLIDFEKFADTTIALSETTALTEGKCPKSLRKFLKRVMKEGNLKQLHVMDPKLGCSIKEKLQLECISNAGVQELMRCIRSQADALICDIKPKEMNAMALGLAHSLSRYKLKFSPDKVDTMIVQAVGLLDDLDKELNNYVMRCREWYGWHFPELGKIITDNISFVKAVRIIGTRENALNTDLSDIIPEEIEEQVKESAEISMGTEICDDDIIHIHHLCEKIIQMTNYREKLYEYLKVRMLAIAPNLTVLMGELVAARLISHAGSLINLAKQPASTVQILGAEKALFRALKARKDTPKYGLIYHSSMVSQSSTKLKGKVARMLAAKAALATRVDALGETNTNIELGPEHKAKLESRIRFLEDGNSRRISGTGKAKAAFEKYRTTSVVQKYDPSRDNVSKKRKFDQVDEDNEAEVKKEKKPKLIEVISETTFDEEIDTEKKKKKKKKHDTSIKEEIEETSQPLELETSQDEPSKKKKKKKAKIDLDASSSSIKQEENEEEPANNEKAKKKKKKKSLDANQE